ncbi:MAG: histidine phosphatase family protein [bacterium]|nr:histidine phosphatase family protein [bacterium]
MNSKLLNDFYVVRHGKAKNNDLGIESCKMDTQSKYGLLDEGKEVVAKEAQCYSDFDIIYSSPFRRTKETAAYFADTSKCEIIADERLVGIDLGDLDQQSYEVFNAATKDKDNDYVYPNGESFSQALSRLVEFITEINAKHSDKKILIVSHGFSCEALLDWINGKPLKDWDKCIEKGKVFPLNV